MSASVCPFVATGTDSSKRSSQPSAAHSCYATRPAEPIDLQRQGELCLTQAFTACPIFLAWASREAAQTVDAPATQPLPFDTSSARAPVDLAAATLGTDEAAGGLDDLPEGSIWSAAPGPDDPNRRLSPSEEERLRVVPLHKRRTMDDEAPRAPLRLPKIPGGTRGAAALLVLASLLAGTLLPARIALAVIVAVTAFAVGEAGRAAADVPARGSRRAAADRPTARRGRRGG